MKTFKIFLILTFLFASIVPAYAMKGILSTKEDVINLKKDLLNGKIQAGKTRLKDFREKYGDAPSIKVTDKAVIYQYDDLKIEFERKRYLRKWGYDYSHKPAYSDEIDDLRYDLEDQQIVGDYYTLKEIKKDYDEPTEAFETFDDGDKSIYYYGEIKLTFENVITVKKWEGKNLDDVQEGIYQSADNLIEKKEEKAEEKE